MFPVVQVRHLHRWIRVVIYTALLMDNLGAQDMSSAGAWSVTEGSLFFGSCSFSWQGIRPPSPVTTTEKFSPRHKHVAFLSSKE